VFRTEGYAGCDFGKALIATTSFPTFTDADVANGRAYSYVVQAVGTTDPCYGPVSECLTSTPQPCAGSVRLDRDVYNCDDMLTILLVDSDLAGTGAHAVSLSSEAESTAETIMLAEVPGQPGRFEGTVSTTSGPPATGDGMLSVSHGDTITVEYVDESFCGVPDVTVDHTAPVDCLAPVLSNVRAVDVTGQSVDILWDTDELSDSSVVYDVEIPPVAGMLTDPDAVTSHEIHLAGLEECSLYHFAVSSKDLAENVGVDDNDGAYHSFETGVNVNPTYPTLDPPVPILDHSVATSTIVVSDEEPVQDVDVTVNITHTYDGDISLSLIGPDDTEVVLSYRHGGGGNDYVETVFDDEADTPIADGDPPFTGRYIPDEPLSAFDGKIATGTWTLRVEDHAGGDTGSIDSWSLTLMYPPMDCGPRLKHESHALEDRCTGLGLGDGNGRAEPGEDVLMPVVLRNSGTDPTTGISARLTTATPGVMVTQATAAYPDLAPGEAAGSHLSAFAFTVGADVLCGTSIEFTLEASANEGVWTDAFTVRVGSELGMQCSNCYVPQAGPVASLGWTPGSTASLEWSPATYGSFYQVYRGVPPDLPYLMDESVDSCRRLTTTAVTTGEVLSEMPQVGSFYWYLVRAGNGGGEGPAGDTSSSPRIQNGTDECP
jgi:subtilisin-like proprotein convertase family protein